MKHDPEKYDRWYRTPRGAWIGGLEYGLLRRLLKPQPHESVLDVGCGTGHFTRCFARDHAAKVVGVDPDAEAVEYARRHAANRESYTVASGEALPFPSRSFDLSVSVTALCFVQNEAAFVREMARVTRRCVAIGLLHRHSLLWLREGRDGGRGGYRGARWHSRREAVQILATAGLTSIVVRTALSFPSGHTASRIAENIIPSHWMLGGFLLLTGRVGGEDEIE